MPVVRFAPSPTGRIHIGNTRTALLNWCVAKRAGGRFILRFDDTDRERSRPEYAEAIAVDLAWLGVAPDLTVRQSDRIALYDAAVERLQDAGRLYACYETEEELERRRKRQMARGLPPVYDRAALKLTVAEKMAFEMAGRRPHWRFLLEHRIVAWEDGVRGPAHIDTASLSDPVLVRADGGYLYTLPSVVDDIDLAVDHVIRGEDHVTNTAVQIQIFQALGAAVPAFSHHNLLTTASGEGLSKRSGALSIGSLRDGGLEPMAVASLAMLTGTAEAVRPVATLAELAGLIDLSRISRAPARFDPADLETLNARLLHEMPHAAVAGRLAALGVGGGEAFWLAVRGNIVRLTDAASWWRVVTGPVAPVLEDRAFAQAAAALLPPEPWDEGTWAAWVEAVKAATGAKGRSLFMPLRLALTGLEHGPELKALLPLIGRDRALARLEGAA
ncbi:glutamate--tRNA ligase [Labrys wisconsinensis]|uniref:Glutamate--tRNA ligase n=1 Tax=Labrys wisconsinensis TaxID=425677 RepID=A0ABU0J9G4_9HYPH|nr:glutamate--tRNA ligase [Labrys wisconsinensis]MDQ0470913.1 glutamyl-tRNA synthetase [Labrys wisconsinensis]